MAFTYNLLTAARSDSLIRKGSAESVKRTWSTSSARAWTMPVVSRPRSKEGIHEDGVICEPLSHATPERQRRALAGLYRDVIGLTQGARGRGRHGAPQGSQRRRHRKRGRQAAPLNDPLRQIGRDDHLTIHDGTASPTTKPSSSGAPSPARGGHLHPPP